MIAIPDPEGFEEVTERFEKLKTLFRASEPPENDLLGGYLPVSDCDLLRRGENAPFTYYAKAAVLRIGREHLISPSYFEEMVAYFRNNDETLMDPDSPKMKAMIQQMDQALSKGSSKEIKLDLSQPKNLGAFDVRPNVYSVMLLMSLKVESGGTLKTLPVAATLTYLRVKEKVIFVYTYRKYQSKTDVETLRGFTTKWTNSILAAN